MPPEVARPTSPRVVPYVEAEHAAGLFDLYAEIFGEGKARRLRERFEWQYGLPPARRSGQIANWVLLSGDRVVGHLGVVHVELRFGDVSGQGCWGIDLMVHPSHRRGKGLLELFTKLHSAAEIPMGYGMADGVGRTYERLGYRRIAVGSHLLYPCTWRAVLGLGGRRWRLVRSLLAGLLRPVEPRGDDLVVTMFSKELVVELAELWGKVAVDYPVAVVRSSDYLAWRYGRRGMEARCVTVRGEAGLRACALLESFRWRGLRAGQISELMMPRDEAASLLPPLLDRAAEAFRRQGVDLILTEGFPREIRDLLCRHGFVELDPRRSEIAVFLNRDDRMPSEFASESTDDWLFTPGDSDRSTAYRRLRWRV